MDDNDQAGVAVKQPTTLAERSHAAGLCGKALKITMPMVVDTLDDKVGRMYSGLPDRLYVIDKAGKITYRGARGPFGFQPREMEQALAATLIFDAPASERKDAAKPAAVKGK